MDGGDEPEGLDRELDLAALAAQRLGALVLALVGDPHAEPPESTPVARGKRRRAVKNTTIVVRRKAA